VWGRREMRTGFGKGTARKEEIGRHRRRREYNVKVDFRETENDSVDWITVA
jgi:hypothetical protein